MTDFSQDQAQAPRRVAARPLIAAALGASIVGTAGGGLLGQALSHADIADALASRPPTAVIDYSAIERALKAGTPIADLHPALERLRERGRRLAEAGYLVINAAATESPPADLLVPSGDIGLVPAPAPPPAAAPPAAATPSPPISSENARAILDALLTRPEATR